MGNLLLTFSLTLRAQSRFGFVHSLTLQLQTLPLSATLSPLSFVLLTLSQELKLDAFSLRSHPLALCSPLRFRTLDALAHCFLDPQLRQLELMDPVVVLTEEILVDRSATAAVRRHQGVVSESLSTGSCRCCYDSNGEATEGGEE